MERKDQTVTKPKQASVCDDKTEDDLPPHIPEPSRPLKRKHSSDMLDFLKMKYQREAELKEREIEIQKEKLKLEQDKLQMEKEEREKRFELERQERMAFIELLKKKI